MLPLPSQARARSRAAASARSRVRGGSCCARSGRGQPRPLEADHATAPAPYRKTGVAPRREVLNCRPSKGRRFKIRDHHSSRLHQIRPGVPAHMQPMVRRTAPTKAPSRNPCQSDSDSRKSNVRLTRAGAESSRMTWSPNPQPGAPHVGEEVSRPRVENGANATTPEGHEILPGSGGTYSRKLRVPVPYAAIARRLRALSFDSLLREELLRFSKGIVSLLSHADCSTAPLCETQCDHGSRPRTTHVLLER